MEASSVHGHGHEHAPTPLRLISERRPIYMNIVQAVVFRFSRSTLPFPRFLAPKFFPRARNAGVQYSPVFSCYCYLPCQRPIYAALMYVVPGASARRAAAYHPVTYSPMVFAPYPALTAPKPPGPTNCGRRTHLDVTRWLHSPGQLFDSGVILSAAFPILEETAFTAKGPVISPRHNFDISSPIKPCRIPHHHEAPFRCPLPPCL